jgi:esterase
MEIDFSKILSREEVDDFMAQKIDDLTNPPVFTEKCSKEQGNQYMFYWRVNAEVLYSHLDEIVSGVNKNWLDDRIPIIKLPCYFYSGYEIEIHSPRRRTND